MEGPDVEGPKVWVELNKKCEIKIIGLIQKNEERTAWMRQYLEDCKAKIGAKCPEPEFVPKTPAQPKRGGRRGKASAANSDVDVNVSVQNTTKNTSTKSIRSTRATRAAERDLTISSIDETCNADAETVDTTNTVDITKTVDSTNEVSEAATEESYTPPSKKQSLSDSASTTKKSIQKSTTATPEESLIVAAEPANATFSSENSTVASGIIDATFDVGSSETHQPESENVINNQTFDASKVPPENISQDEDQFIEAQVVDKPHEVVSNIVEILKSAEKVDDKLPSPIPAPRSINKVLVTQSVDDTDNKSGRSTRTKQKLIVEEATTDPSNAATATDDSAAKRSTRTKTKNPSGDSDSAPPTRSTRTKQKILSTDDDKTASETEGEDSRPVRSSRTRQKIVASTDEDKSASETEGVENRPVRSSRTRQKIAASTDDEKTASEPESAENARPARSTRTKQKQLAGSCSESTLTKGAASPRVRQLAAQVLSPALKQSNSTSKLVGGYTGSPVRDRVKVFEQAMKESAGLKSIRKSRRKSSITISLEKASAARNISIDEMIVEQEVVVKKGPTIKKSPGVSTNTSVLNNSRAPAGKVVRPGRKVLASGGRGMTPSSSGPKSGSRTGSSSNLMKSRSRLDIIERNKTTPSKANPPSNMVRGVTSFLPAKPKGPTLQEIQEQKEEERRLKEKRELEAKQRREDQMKNKMEEQRLKREERIRRVQEARQQQESQRENKMRKNQEKDKEEKLALLKKREDNLKAEAEKRKKENELKLKEAEERRAREEEERLARKDKLDNERLEEERRKEEEQEQRRRKQEEERRRKIQEEEKRKRQEEQRREEERRRAEEEKKRAAALQQERIAREKEELRKLKEKEAARQLEQQPRQADTTLNKTVTLDQSQAGGVSSYDMTPARHELPPEPSHSEDNYGLEDLKSDEDTDDEDCPRKQVPKWAEGTQLRTALLKQCYMGPDLDQIFCTIEMPDLTVMFDHQRKRFHKRTSSACWETPPESFKHSKRW